MSDIVYLDHAATTATDPRVVEAMLPYFVENYGNPSTLYALGRQSRDAMEKARTQVAGLLHCRPDEIAFTSGGTEADNWAIKGVALALRNKGRHIVTTPIEHHAVFECCHTLEKLGFEVTEVPVDECGLVSPDDVRQALREDTILISVMHANNEIGTIEPVEEIGAMARQRGVTFHTDAVQTVAHLPIDLSALPCDLLSLSGHKFYGPKGVGALFIRKGTKIGRYLEGGGQEDRRRASTENVPGIVGLGAAAEFAAQDLEERARRETALRDDLIKRLFEAIPDCLLNGHRTERLPGNVNLSVIGVEGESMLMLLDRQGICASTGSACTTGSLSPSHVLTAIGVPVQHTHGSLRLTLGRDNTPADVDRVLDVLPPIVERLRAMSPMYGRNAPAPDPATDERGGD